MDSCCLHGEPAHGMAKAVLELEEGRKSKAFQLLNSLTQLMTHIPCQTTYKHGRRAGFFWKSSGFFEGKKY